jgi:hypothetical protein
MTPRTALAITFILVPLAALATHQYEAATTFTDANRGGFVDAAPVFSSGTGKEDEDSDFIYEYAWVPYRHDLHPIFCTRRGIARTVTCFYVDPKAPHGGVLVEAVIPKD